MKIQKKDFQKSITAVFKKIKITINKEVFKVFHPQFKVAFILARNVSQTHAKEAKHLLRDMVRVVRLTHKKDTLRNHNLISPWRVLVEDKKKRARHYQTSLEKLMGKVLNKRGIIQRDAASNLINYVSLKNVIPISGDNVNKLQGNVVFKLATGRERLYLKRIKKGTLVYGDELSPIGTKLDFKKNRRTKINKKSTNILIHIDAVPPITKKKLNEISQETAQLLRDFCGAKTSIAILSRGKNSVSIK